MKKLAALILALVMCLSLAACSSSGGKESQKPSSGNSGSDKSFSEFDLSDWEAYAEENDAKYKVLYIPSWAASEYFQNSYEAWKKQFEAIGWELEMQGPKEYTADSQLGTLEAALISQNYDAIVLYPIAAEAFEAVLDEMWDTYGIPIICWGMAESTGAGNYYLMNDDRYKLIGEFMAKMIIEYVDSESAYFSKYDGQGIPVTVFGSANNPVQNARVLRCVELLEADGRFKIVEHYENVSDDKTLEYAESMLLNHPETEIVVAYNDVQTVYIDTALKDTSVKLSDHLKLYGVDGTKAARSLLLAEGDKSFIGGSVMSNHNFIGDEIIYTCKVAIPAAEEGILVDGLTARNVDVFVNGENSINITAANVADYPVE